MTQAIWLAVSLLENWHPQISDDSPPKLTSLLHELERYMP